MQSSSMLDDSRFMFGDRAFKRAKSQGFKRVPKPKANAFLRQVKALVAGKKKDAADVARNTTTQTATTISCLTSSTNFATAASGTGLLDMDGDSALINSVRVRGTISNLATVDLDPTGNNDVNYRMILVWFNKPLLVASAAGTLPPITEVLVTDDAKSLVVTANANAGRFQILSDKTYNIGTNTFASTGGLASRVQGNNNRTLDHTFKVGKTCHFAAPSVSGTPAGHYDSDVAPGRIDKGLLVLYTLIDTKIIAAADINLTLNSRLNYTG